MSRTKLAAAAVAGTLAITVVSPAQPAFAQEESSASSEDSFSSTSSEMTSSERTDEIITGVVAIGLLFALGAAVNAGWDPSALIWALALA